MSLKIDGSKCTGCGACVNICPKRAITINGILAMIDENLCIQCGACAEVCSVGAIREVVPAHVKLSKGGDNMRYGYGRGFGFRGASPPWPYVGRGRGGLPRCWHLGAVMAPAGAPALYGGYPVWEPTSYSPQMPKHQQLGFLREEANALRSQLEEIESRIEELEAKEA